MTTDFFKKIYLSFNFVCVGMSTHLNAGDYRGHTMALNPHPLELELEAVLRHWM